MAFAVASVLKRSCPQQRLTAAAVTRAVTWGPGQSEIGWNDLKWDALRIFPKSKQRQGSIRVKKTAAVGANRSGRKTIWSALCPSLQLCECRAGLQFEQQRRHATALVSGGGDEQFAHVEAAVATVTALV